MNTQTFTILIVEDERPLLEAIRLKFDHNGIEPVTARSVDQALGYIDEGIEIDAVWLDHYLFGKKTGLDFVTAFKLNEKYRNIPIFVVSNSSTYDKKHTYLTLGVEKYYVKAEHRLEDLVSDVKNFIANGEQ